MRGKRAIQHCVIRFEQFQNGAVPSEQVREKTDRFFVEITTDRDELGEMARAVLVLFEIEGYPHEEIADAMGVSVGTSKAQLHRARALLRKLLA